MTDLRPGAESAETDRTADVLAVDHASTLRLMEAVQDGRIWGRKTVVRQVH